MLLFVKYIIHYANIVLTKHYFQFKILMAIGNKGQVIYAVIKIYLNRS